MTEVESLAREYTKLLNQQPFDEDDLDYTLLERHKPFLNQLAKVGNSGVTVFDMHKRTHIFTSYNFQNLFGYDLEQIDQLGNQYFDERVHPDDFLKLLRNGIALLHFLYQTPKEERGDFKLVNEYRIRNQEEQYIRVVEQHQALEMDKRGNVWLSLGVIDLSPDQTDSQEVKCQVINFRTGKIQPVPQLPNRKGDSPKVALSEREKEVLALVKEGYLSKEISGKLSISIHTVNTYRQRILEKLNADNSMEAIKYASRLGLVQ